MLRGVQKLRGPDGNDFFMTMFAKEKEFLQVFHYVIFVNWFNSFPDKTPALPHQTVQTERQRRCVKRIQELEKRHVENRLVLLVKANVNLGNIVLKTIHARMVMHFHID